MNLNYKKLGEEEKNVPLVILHGMFGMLDNWQTLGKKFAETQTVYLVDQRNHGKSPHSREMDYYLLAEDLLEWMNALDLENVNLLGHSMGGKTAMQFAIENEERINKLIIADIAPKAYPAGGHNDVFDGFFAVDIDNITSRKEAEDALATKLSDRGTIQFLLKNLSRQKDGTYRWKCNLEVIYESYSTILGNSLSAYDIFEGPTLFLKGEKSKRYIQFPDDEILIKHHFKNSEIKTITNSGHWIHAEQPEQVFEAVSNFLQ